MKVAEIKILTPIQKMNSNVRKYYQPLSLKAPRMFYDADSSTTRAYCHIPEELVNDEINRVISSHLDRIAGQHRKGAKK